MFSKVAYFTAQSKIFSIANRPKTNIPVLYKELRNNNIFRSNIKIFNTEKWLWKSDFEI
jgi:hypothetical protein